MTRPTSERSSRGAESKPAAQRARQRSAPPLITAFEQRKQLPLELRFAVCFACDERVTIGALQSSGLEEQLVQPLPARVDLDWNWAGHSKPPGQPGTRRDGSALGSCPMAAAPLLMSDGLCIPGRPMGPPVQNPENSRDSHQITRFCPAGRPLPET